MFVLHSASLSWWLLRKCVHPTTQKNVSSPLLCNHPQCRLSCRPLKLVLRGVKAAVNATSTRTARGPLALMDPHSHRHLGMKSGRLTCYRKYLRVSSFAQITGRLHIWRNHQSVETCALEPCFRIALLLARGTIQPQSPEEAVRKRQWVR